MFTESDVAAPTYIDDESADLFLSGAAWSSASGDAWDLTYHQAVIAVDEIPQAEWLITPLKSGKYRIENLWPLSNASCDSVTFTLSLNSEVLFSKTLDQIKAEWQSIGFAEMAEGNSYTLTVNYYGSVNNTVIADAIRVNSYIAPRYMHLIESYLQFGEGSVGTPLTHTLEISNEGYESLDILGFKTVNGYVTSDAEFPLTLAAGEKYDLVLSIA